VDYIELICEVREGDVTMVTGILVAQLAEIGFESFDEEGGTLKAYIQSPLFDEYVMGQLEVFNLPGVVIDTRFVKIDDRDWNEEWEKNFKPVWIANKCRIRASFHDPDPSALVELVIDPRMAFGTGHHETTSLAIELILEMEWKGTNVLDMGTGTGILSILVSKLGAQKVLAIDIDEWAVNNTLDNLVQNQVSQVLVLQGDVEMIPDEKFPKVIANINLNVITRDLKHYVGCLSSKGQIILSGFYSQDVPLVEKEASMLGCKIVKVIEKNNWVAMIIERVME
jgi:ribosomal protein L11 methyltransferase